MLQLERSLAGGEARVPPLGGTIPLLFDVLTQHTERCAATTEHTIGPTPEHRFVVPPRQLLGIGFPQEPRRHGLQVIDEGGHAHRWRQFDEEMHMIRFAIALDQCAPPLVQQRCKCPREVLAHSRGQALAAILCHNN